MDAIIENFLITKYNHSTQFPQNPGSMYCFVPDKFVFITKGTAEFHIEENTYYAKENDVVYIPSNTVYYSIWRGSSDIEWYDIAVSFSKKYENKMQELKIIKYFNMDRVKEVYNLFAKNELLNCFGNVCLLMDDLQKQFSTKIIPYRSDVSRAISYIQLHFSEKLKISYLAKLCNMSESGFYRAFKEETGYTPIQYKNKQIVTNSIKMFSNLCSIESISEYFHFSSPKYFNRVFKSVTGKTPMQYKKEYFKNQPD